MRVRRNAKGRYDPVLSFSDDPLGASMGGSSGALYSIFLNAVATALGKSAATPTPAECAAAFSAGCDAMSQYGGASTGHRTMLDALLPAAEAMRGAAGGGMASMLQSAAAAAEAGAEATKTMQAGAGRASYVPDDVLRGTPDPGAKAVALWLGAVAKSVAA